MSRVIWPRTPPTPVAAHGLVGTIIDLGTSTLSVTDPQNNEQSIAISSGTVIRDGDSDSVIGDMAVGDQIAVIGGVCGSMLAATGYLWLSVSDLARRHRVAFIREARQQMDVGR